MVNRYVAKRKPSNNGMRKWITPSNIRTVARVAKKGYELWDSYSKKRKRSQQVLYARTRRRVSRRTYKTSGRMGRPFRKTRAIFKSKFALYGSSLAIESGGVLTNADCTYVGHALAKTRLIEAFSSALVFKLFRKAGFSIGSPEDKPSMNSPGANDYRFILRYSVGEGGQVNLVERNFLLTESYWTMADTVATLLFALAAGGQPPFELIQAQLCHIDNTAATSDAPILASCQLAGSTIEFACYSNLSIQNRTISSTAVGDASNDNRNDVANNPIAGKQYMGFGNGTNIRMQDRAGPGTVGMIADANTGVISLDLADVNLTTAQFESLRRPPRGDSFTNVSSQRQSFLNPGYIKTGRVEYKKSMRVSSFMLNMRDSLSEGASSTTRISMGKFQFFAFEKKCNTRVDEPVISVGYELNQTYQCIVREAKTAVSTHVTVL